MIAPLKSPQATDELTFEAHGPFAVSRSCRLCGHAVVRRKVAGSGRGAGFREGNKQRGAMHQHMKDRHPNALARALEILNANGRRTALPINELRALDPVVNRT